VIRLAVAGGRMSASPPSSMPGWARSGWWPLTCRAPRAMPSRCRSSGGQKYELIDTAGIRRKGRVFEAIEKFSVVKTLQAIENAHVVLLLLDATQGVTDQDAHIAGYILESGRAVVMAINKWDAVDAYQRQQVERQVESRLAFLKFASMHLISASKRQGLGPLWKSMAQAHASAMRKMPTPVLTRLLQEAVAFPGAAAHRHVPAQMRYAHQGGMNPPVIVIHGNSLEHVPDVYKRFPGRPFPQGLRPGGYAAAHRVQDLDQPLQGLS
jgi:GTPase